MKTSLIKTTVTSLFLLSLMVAFVQWQIRDEILRDFIMIKLKSSMKSIMKPHDLTLEQKLSDLDEVMNKTKIFLDQHPIPLAEPFNCDLIKNNNPEIELELKEDCLYSIFRVAEFNYTKKRDTARFIFGLLVFAIIPLGKWVIG